MLSASAQGLCEDWKKPEKEKSWREKISKDMEHKSNEIKASVLDADVKYDALLGRGLGGCM